jgi:hypothetical protein
MSAGRWSDDVRLWDTEPLLVCTGFGRVGAEVRPHFEPTLSALTTTTRPHEEKTWCSKLIWRNDSWTVLRLASRFTLATRANELMNDERGRFGPHQLGSEPRHFDEALWADGRL